ncbi:MAG: MBL fold metallo-hydrolase [Lachnospiraceae bacterium]|nr:MBL fold metallo-hydrolase [Lachnospiraceae bacterium]
MNQILIKWNGHSCFSVTADDYTIVLDPYAPDSVPGLPALSLTANRVLCSHTHRDHGCTDVVTVEEKGACPFAIHTIDTFHDDAKGTLRGSNRIHILEAYGMRVAHLGDLGCSLTSEQEEQLKAVEAILIPVGGYYTIDADQAFAIVSSLNPRVVIPMHYRSDRFGYPVIGRLEAFTGHCMDVVTYDTDTLVLTPETEKQTAVLSLA